MYKSTTLLTLLLLIIHNSLYAQESVIDEFKVELAQHQGKVVYLDFWASWCTPCRKAFPWLNEMQAKYQQQGLVVLAVNVDYDQSFAKEFLAEVPATFDIFYDSEGRVARSYQLEGMPTSFVLDRNGKVIARHTGFKVEKMAQYEQKIQQALKQ